ncbi:MAG: hypothetical protein R3C44_13960 [Chloroflexota bacterium]
MALIRSFGRMNRVMKPPCIPSAVTIEAANAGDLLAWTIQLEETPESRRGLGCRPWPTCPGVCDHFAGAGAVGGIKLTGGVALTRQHRGIGTRLLDAVKRDSTPLALSPPSCMVPDLTGPVSGFLLNRGFYVEHEECLLELDIAHELPPSPDMPELSLQTFPRAQTVTLFPAVYKQSFGCTSWAQPYSETETDALLAEPEDILYLMRMTADMAWIETMSNGHGRIEPFGSLSVSIPGLRPLAVTRRSEELQRRGVQTASLGLWRDNTGRPKPVQTGRFC